MATFNAFASISLIILWFAPKSLADSTKFQSAPFGTTASEYPDISANSFSFCSLASLLNFLFNVEPKKRPVSKPAE